MGHSLAFATARERSTDEPGRRPTLPIEEDQRHFDVAVTSDVGCGGLLGQNPRRSTVAAIGNLQHARPAGFPGDEQLVPVFADSEAGAARGAARRKADERRQGKSRRQEQRRRHCRLALGPFVAESGAGAAGSGMWDGKLLEAAHRLQGTVEPTHEEPGLSSRDYKPDRDIAPAE